MAILAVPGSAVPQVMEDAGKKGVKLAVVIAAGFKEIGEEGEDLREENARYRKRAWDQRS